MDNTSTPSNGANLMTYIIEGIGQNDRLGTQIRLHRIDLRFFMQVPGGNAIVPNEEVHLSIVRQKQFEIAPYRNNGIYNAPAWTVPPPGLPQGPFSTWMPDSQNAPYFQLLKRKVFIQRNPMPMMISGSTVPNAYIQSDPAHTLPLNYAYNNQSGRNYRQYGNIRLDWRKPLTVTFFATGEDTYSVGSYLTPTRGDPWNHIWLIMTGETPAPSAFSPDLRSKLYWHADVWFSDF